MAHVQCPHITSLRQICSPENSSILVSYISEALLYISKEPIIYLVHKYPSLLLSNFQIEQNVFNFI